MRCLSLQRFSSCCAERFIFAQSLPFSLTVAADDHYFSWFWVLPCRHAQVMAENPGKYPQKAVAAHWLKETNTSVYRVQDKLRPDHQLEATPMSKCPNVSLLTSLPACADVQPSHHTFWPPVVLSAHLLFVIIFHKISE